MLNAPFEFLIASCEFLTGRTIWSPKCSNWNPKCIFKLNFTVVWWEDATAQRFFNACYRFWTTVQRLSTISEETTQQYSDYNRIGTMLNYSARIFIDVQFKSKHDSEQTSSFLFKRTTVHRFASSVNDFEWYYNGGHRFETILTDSTKMFIEFQLNNPTV